MAKYKVRFETTDAREQAEYDFHFSSERVAAKFPYAAIFPRHAVTEIKCTENVQ